MYYIDTIKFSHLFQHLPNMFQLNFSHIQGLILFSVVIKSYYIMDSS